MQLSAGSPRPVSPCSSPIGPKTQRSNSERSSRCPDSISLALEAETLQSLHSKRPSRSLHFKSERRHWSQPRLAVAQAVESHAHELLLAVVIVANLVAFVLETDGRVENADVRKWEFLSRFVFLPIYTIDLCARLYVYQIDFYKNKWNVMDASLVLCDLLMEVVGLIVQDETKEVQVFSLLRVLRLCRLARFARVMVIFKELHMMFHAFLSAMKTMFWASCMLAVLLTLFSILAVEFVHPVNAKLAERGDYGDCVRCERAFSSVMHANLTFVQQILAGDNWGRLNVPIIEEQPAVAIILISALVMINLGMLNLILTVIVNAASEARKNDKRLQANENLQKFEAMEKKLVRVCAELDANSDGILSLGELVDALDTNAEFRDICEALDIHKDDMGVIYAFLDTDGDGMVTYTEFVEQAFKIRNLDVNSFLVTLRGKLNRLSMDMRIDIRNIKSEFRALAKDVRAIATCVPLPQSLLKVDIMKHASRGSSGSIQHMERFRSSGSGTQNLMSPKELCGSERFSSNSSEKQIEADAFEADCDLRFLSTHSTLNEPKQRDLGGLCLAELENELASLRQRLDDNITGFVATTLSKFDAPYGTIREKKDRPDDGPPCLSPLRADRRDRASPPTTLEGRAANGKPRATSDTRSRSPTTYESTWSSGSRGRRKTESL